jgi:hypothetical protein
MSDENIRRVRTWAELEAWFTGEAEGVPVFYSPDTNPEWDDLWLRLDNEPELGRGMRSFSLSAEDLHWLRAVLNVYFASTRPGKEER